MGHRLWLPAVAIHRLGVIEIAPSHRHCFRTAHPCAQSVKGSPTEPVLSRYSRQRLGHIQSPFDGGWHVYQAVFPEPQSAAARRRVERGESAHSALPRLQSASSWSVMEQLVSGVCRLLCAFQAAGNSPPDVKRGDTLSKFVGLRQPGMIRQQSCRTGVTVCACIRFACVIRSGYLVLANQHTSSEGQGSRDLRQTRVEPY